MSDTPFHRATAVEIDRAVKLALVASKSWAQTILENRVAVLHRFADQLRAHHDELRDVICAETGKPRWESAGEVDSMIGKVAISIGAHQTRRAEIEFKIGDGSRATRYKPHGVVAVLGPFNFPGHLPNGHITPALLAGNTVIFKPSELTPLTARQTLECWRRAGLPELVLQIIEGEKETGQALVTHPDIDGVFFTGSFATGRSINRALADHPGKIAALEMGGNNPLIIHHPRDLTAAAYLTIQSAYLTAGQRCSCARRLIVTGDAEPFLQTLVAMIGKIRVGRYTDNPEPFMGPVIHNRAAHQLLAAQTDLIARGAKPLVEMKSLAGLETVSKLRITPQTPGLRYSEDPDPRFGNSFLAPNFLSPGLLDVTQIKTRDDVEHFGPLLQLIRVATLDDAIVEANNTQFGLAAGILTDDRAAYETFFAQIRAGVVNWNRPLTGASSALPFGGIKNSGNHRPSASFAADYCDYPIASLESESLTLPPKLPPGINP